MKRHVTRTLNNSVGVSVRLEKLNVSDNIIYKAVILMNYVESFFLFYLVLVHCLGR